MTAYPRPSARKTASARQTALSIDGRSGCGCGRRARRRVGRWFGPLAGLLRLQPVLGHLRIDVDVLLPGQLHQLVHDLVGYRAQDEAVALEPFVAGEVEGRSDPDTY